jgi:hypothetical protein
MGTWSGASRRAGPTSALHPTESSAGNRGVRSKQANALAAAWAHESTSASVNKRTPPPGLRVRALVVARLLAATDAFAAFLDDEGGAGPTAGESSGKSTGKSTAGYRRREQRRG